MGCDFISTGFNNYDRIVYMKKQPSPTIFNHNVGDILIIRNGFYGHGFAVNSKVKITARNISDYRAENKSGAFWWVADQNFMTKKQLAEL